MADSITTARTSRKNRYCDGCDRPAIKRGDRYLSHVAFPSHDATDGTFWRMAECAGCAARYGRGEQLAAPAPGAADDPTGGA